MLTCSSRRASTTKKHITASNWHDNEGTAGQWDKMVNTSQPVGQNLALMMISSVFVPPPCLLLLLFFPGGHREILEGEKKRAHWAF